MDTTERLFIAVLTGFIGLAIVAIIISRNAATVGVIGAATTGFGQILQVAVSPVTGGSPFASSGAGGSQPFAGGGVGSVLSNTGGIIQNLAPLFNSAGGILGN